MEDQSVCVQYVSHSYSCGNSAAEENRSARQVQLTAVHKSFSVGVQQQQQQSLVYIIATWGYFSTSSAVCQGRRLSGLVHSHSSSVALRQNKESGSQLQWKKECMNERWREKFWTETCRSNASSSLQWKRIDIIPFQSLGFNSCSTRSAKVDFVETICGLQRSGPMMLKMR